MALRSLSLGSRGDFTGAGVVGEAVGPSFAEILGRAEAVAEGAGANASGASDWIAVSLAEVEQPTVLTVMTSARPAAAPITPAARR